MVIFTGMALNCHPLQQTTGQFRRLIISLMDRSLFINWAEGGRRILGGDHLIFERTKGGISRN